MKNLPKLLTAIIICELVGLLGTPFTVSAIPTWYATLAKPVFSPPNWVFGPVWTVLYALMGISAYIVWSKGTKNKKIRIAMAYFVIQLVCNFFWSILFFGFRSPVMGLVDIIILWFFIIRTIQKFFPVSRVAAYLLVPYFLWVSFATALNIAIVILNP